MHGTGASWTPPGVGRDVSGRHAMSGSFWVWSPTARWGGMGSGRAHRPRAPCGDVGEPWSSLCPLHPGCSPGSGGARWVQMPPVGTGGGSGLAGWRLPRLRPHPTSRLRFRAPSSPPSSAREVCSGQGSRGPAVFSFSVPFGMTVPATEPLCFSEALL